MFPALIAALLFAQAATGTAVDYSTTTVREYASVVARQEGLNEEHFVKTIECESGFDYKVIGPYGEVGAVQIYPVKHPGILYLEMIDPYWSIRWMAREWNEDRAWQWACWHILGYG